MLGGHALDVVEGLTVSLPRVHVEILGSFCSAVISEVASSLASLQVAEEGGIGERLPGNTTVSLGESAPHLSPEALDRSRSALGLPPPVVVDDGPDADEQAVGKRAPPTTPASLKHGEHDKQLRNFGGRTGGLHVESRRFSSWLVP